ncbi:MAG TPA: helix-turn-helix domain-containing protein [Candidatus Angelobacter sp.]|nr:helix-turn-helix domain-containing protein [Candidatus Angelobacter sp.]
MAQVRLDSDERRQDIVETALPLFARKGFMRTTTKEIAEAAGISEALVFKHFPSKAALYEEILRQGCQADPALDRLNALQPSTATLIAMTHFMVYHFVLGAFDVEDKDTRSRLMVTSFLEDGEFARLVFDHIHGKAFGKFEACLEAAAKAGDLVTLPIAPQNRFWFGHHVAAMLAQVRLPGRPIAPYSGDTNGLIKQAVWFVLRGIGLKDEVIAGQYNPEALSIFLGTTA